MELNMRQFATDPLSVNRLRTSERNGDVLLRRPLMEPSTSSEFCEGNVVDYNENGFNQYNPRFSDCTETYPAPPSDFCRKVVNEELGQETVQLRNVRIPELHDDETDLEEEVARSIFRKSEIAPSKSQVLFYLSTSNRLKLHQTGCELQITDSSDFPLLDIWSESVCCSPPVWVMESYGRRVLVISERASSGPSSFSFASFLPGPLASLMGHRRRNGPTLTIIDWNSEVIGYFIPGDPFIIQNNARTTVARCTRIDPQSDNWQCVLEGVSDREVASIVDGSIHFANQVSFQLKLLALAAFARAVGRPKPQTNCFPFLR